MGEKRPERGKRPGVGRLLACVFWIVALAWCGRELHERHQSGAWPWSIFSGPRLEGVVLLPRSRWQAAAQNGMPPSMGRAVRITVHHSGGRAVTEVDSGAAGRAIRAIQDDHVRRNGWNDIGYHYIVDRAGRIWEGRPVAQVGAHAGSGEANRGNIGVLLLGNFELQQPSPAQLAGAERLLEALRRRHGLGRDDVMGHDDVRRDSGLTSTSCPGRNLAPWVERYRRGAAARAEPGATGAAGSPLVKS